MKSIRALALGIVLAVAGLFLVLADVPASAQVLSYQLLTNAAASGPVVIPLGADYLLNVAGIFGGTTLTLQETFNGQTTTLQTLTSAPASPPCLAIPNGATLQMVVTGGSPSGLYANLGGVGSGGCAGTSNAAAGIVTTSPAPRTIIPLDISTVTTGGTAVTALNAGHRTAGGFLTNPKSATIDLCINEQTTASGTTTSGALICVPPGGSYNLTPAAGAVSVIASDSTHPFGGEGLN